MEVPRPSYSKPVSPMRVKHKSKKQKSNTMTPDLARETSTISELEDSEQDYFDF